MKPAPEGKVSCRLLSARGKFKVPYGGPTLRQAAPVLFLIKCETAKDGAASIFFN